MTVLSYPIPLYQNLPIEPQNYQPGAFVISAIQTGQQTLVTTTETHNYVLGQNVRLLIPSSFGSIELNGQQGYVIAIPQPNQVLLNIFSLYVDPFINSTATTQAQIVAIGDINSGYQSSTGNNVQPLLPGSFENISN